MNASHMYAQIALQFRWVFLSISEYCKLLATTKKKSQQKVIISCYMFQVSNIDWHGEYKISRVNIANHINHLLCKWLNNMRNEVLLIVDRKSNVKVESVKKTFSANKLNAKFIHKMTHSHIELSVYTSIYLSVLHMRNDFFSLASTLITNHCK